MLRLDGGALGGQGLRRGQQGNTQQGGNQAGGGAHPAMIPLPRRVSSRNSLGAIWLVSDLVPPILLPPSRPVVRLIVSSPRMNITMSEFQAALCAGLPRTRTLALLALLTVTTGLSGQTTAPSRLLKKSVTG